jgi:hypothetical protein
VTSNKPNKINELGIKDESIQALRDVLADQDANASAKVSAARTLLEAIGVVGRAAQPIADKTKDLSQLSIAELDDEIMRLSAIRPPRS